MEVDLVEIVDILRRSGCLDVEGVARDRSRTAVVEAAVDGFANARACREVMRTVADVDDIVLDIAIPKAAVDVITNLAARDCDRIARYIAASIVIAAIHRCVDYSARYLDRVALHMSRGRAHDVAAEDYVIHCAALYDNMIVLCTARSTIDDAANKARLRQPSCMEIDPVPHGIAVAVGDAAIGGGHFSVLANMDNIVLRAPHTAREAAEYILAAVVIVFQGQRVARYIISICGIVDDPGSTAGGAVRIRGIVARRG